MPQPARVTPSARDEILAKVRRNLPQLTELPDLSRNWTTYPDPVARFSEVLASVGGKCEPVRDLAAVQASLENNPFYAAAKERVSYVEGAGETNRPLEGLPSPHVLKDVDFAVLPGILAVAENGAVWIATPDIFQRTLYFLAQHIAVVVPTRALVHNLHEAYSHIDASQLSFGTFLSGPSKTADIEQALVIGAHGARSLTVYLVESLT